MQKREGRSFAPLQTSPFQPTLGRTGRKGATCPILPLPTVLPSLSSALSRREALFGAVTVASVSVASVLPVQAEPIFSVNDARLVAISAELLEVDTRANALDVDAPGYDALIDRYGPLETEMVATPADTMAGIMAKVQALRIQAVRHCLNGIGNSIAADLWRLHAAGGQAHA